MVDARTIDRLRKDVGDLLDRHEAARSVQDFAVYRDDPVGFIRDVLGGSPWSAQVEIAEAVRDCSLTTVRSCNAAGKDWIAAALALWFVYACGGLVLLTGPTERQVREIVMGEVGRFWIGSDQLPGELYTMALRLGREETSGILALTSTEASRLTGFHAPRILAIITEAQGVEDFAFEAMARCATASRDRILAVGNPVRPSGRFYTIHSSDNWRRFQLSAFEHPNLLEDREVIPGGVTRRFVETMAKEYGKSSSVYSYSVLGEFPEQGEEGLVSRVWLNAAAERHATLNRFELEGEDPIVAVDPARLGPDSSVMAVRRGDAVTELKRWGRMDTAELTGRIVAELRRVGVLPRRVVRDRRGGWDWETTGLVIIDEVGLGAGVLDRLKELRFNAKGFNGGRSPRRSSRFANARAESYWHLRTKLEAGEVALPPNETLFEELLATQWRPNGAGKVTIEAKDEIRGRIGRSPDYADAVTMAVYADRLVPRAPAVHILKRDWA